ncbi:hypothetical protein B7494_g854 [Chlorociboria aeruginascens]|nr:hypothetical protein B7494_g854 [Chlorociboria aeruginascens]
MSHFTFPNETLFSSPTQGTFGASDPHPIEKPASGASEPKSSTNVDRPSGFEVAGVLNGEILYRERMGHGSKREHTKAAALEVKKALAYQAALNATPWLCTMMLITIVPLQEMQPDDGLTGVGMRDVNTKFDVVFMMFAFLMAPIRRYLRITKYSVLECRIYLDNPSLAESWLLNSRDPILPHVIESVRPLVLPKLREENERSKAKGKKRGVKDVVIKDDFEVSIFLTEMSTRHSLLSKQKHFREKSTAGLKSNSRKLTGGAYDDAPVELEDIPALGREDSDDEDVVLDEVPVAPAPAPAAAGDDTVDSLFVDEDEPRPAKRSRVGSGDGLSQLAEGFEPLSKRRRKDMEHTDDEKKMTIDTSYDGFSIYGRVLCLVVKRRDRKGKSVAVAVARAEGGGHAMMEDWIVSTQIPRQEYD